MCVTSPCPGRSSSDASPRWPTGSASCATSCWSPTSSCAHLAEQADDARLRALVSETPLAEQEHREAQRHADAMARHRAEVQSRSTGSSATQDDLLDRLSAELER